MKGIIGFQRAVKLLDAGWVPEELRLQRISEETIQKAIHANEIKWKDNPDDYSKVRRAKTRRQRIKNYTKNGEMC
ncbi:hypothetical protein [Methanosarcina sp. WH1]|uniref:hypothetical protein n=1 Tax=Methanosarcina sp. WH1 TaxID=1434102 RepID=UPI000615E552|nr:hypothetical protein [Methanosarcina sp. WH1]AKB22328.1 hypothetical protein MSWH1_2057 [Methanosarcina sp. WH1]